jgi:5-methylcytosine-specific restriction endonuclease McrA
MEDGSNKNDVLSYPVLMLNKLFMTLRVTTVRNAFTLLYKGSAEVVDKENGAYVLYSFDEWIKVSNKVNGYFINTPTLKLSIPKIIRVKSEAKPYLKNIKLTKKNVFQRDSYICQYCGKSFPPSKLTVDHLIPRSRGGATCWENVVTACKNCNIKKGDRLPQEVNMHPIKKPVRPDSITFVKNLKIPKMYLQYWLDFVK